ncbi:uncharacterized protein LOC123542909 [Mercenaria mercenaria]|uniref:uncharacterized protein LOC123542909 n=1 Tax=Mercenaria mercenaria TaxID=6596 RepID=UPI00234E7349|nr:uncharacterized protein LOC123542909 [Mercenaria mercenaria]
MDWILVIIFISGSLPSAVGMSGCDITIGNIQMLHEHPKLRKCAETILQKHEYIGCRVSVQTGECEGLNHDWGLNQTLEQGYAYAKKLYVEHTLQPPYKLVLDGFESWDIPVVLETGGRIDISFSLESLDQTRFSLYLAEGAGSGKRQLQLSFVDTTLELVEYVDGIMQMETTLTSGIFVPMGIFKISLLAQANSVAVRVKDVAVGTMKLGLANHLRVMRRVRFVLQSKPNMAPKDVFIRKFEFTGK